MSLISYLLISVILFVCGIIVIISRKNIVAMLLGIELILNSSALNFVASILYRSHRLTYNESFVCCCSC